MHIATLLPEVSARYPLLTIELILTDAYLDLIEDRIDIAVRLGSLQDSSYIARRLRKMAFYICASREYLEQNGTPNEPNQVMSHNCLLFPRTGYNLNWLFKDKDGKITDVAISGRCLITNSQAIRACAISGMGLALLPDWLVENDIRSGSLIRLFEDYTVTATDYDGAVWLISPSRQHIPLKTRVFMDYLIRQQADER